MKIVLQPHQKLWFTSDTHYNHANICSATTKWVDPTTIREFKGLEHMNNTIVCNINNCVGQDDILIHLGDWSFGGFDSIKDFRNRIACQNIHLIYGNHDEHIQKNKDGVQSLFTSLHEYLYLRVKWQEYGSHEASDATFVCMHYPIASWNNMARGAMHLHGHVHLSPRDRIGPGKMMDVGMDGNNLKPLEMKEVIRLLKDQPVKSMLTFDHHEKVENYIK